MKDACGPAKVRNSAPRVHTGRGSRHGLVKVERFPCWPEVSVSPQSEIPSRVYTRDGISGTYTDGQLAAKAYAQGRGPPARSYGHLPAKEDWSPSRRQQAPTPRGETTPIVRPPVFPERFSLHARQPGRNFNVRMGRGTLDDLGEDKGRPRDGVTLGPRPPLVDHQAQSVQASMPEPCRQLGRTITFAMGLPSCRNSGITSPQVDVLDGFTVRGRWRQTARVSTHAGLPLPSEAKYMPDWQKLARVSAHASEFLPQLMY
jgi:hypothetical protein